MDDTKRYRPRTHEDDLDAMTEAIHHAMAHLCHAAHHMGCTTLSIYASEHERQRARQAVSAARDALVVAIADRVRDVRAGNP